MRTMQDLVSALRRIDGRGYKAYKDIAGEYDFGEFTLSIDHVQGDPFAAPSRLRATAPLNFAEIPARHLENRTRRVATADFLTRRFAESIRRICRQNRGSGKSGLFSIDSGGQEVLERTSILLHSAGVEARFTVGLPAAGRRVLGRQAEEMLLSELPRIVSASLRYRSLQSGDLESHVDTVEDQEEMRGQLAGLGLVSFVGNGSILPRSSGVDDRPLLTGHSTPVVPFSSPPELEVELTRPNGGPIRGMGIPEGVTLIVGGGFHGKSTLLRSLERGIYNHIPGDGRERVVSLETAVKIRAEDGRSVVKVDISPFISNLPFERDTRQFSTENASGSTSQAANILEALEIGTDLLLIDEDTSATNFIIRDARMQELVSKEREPITPFVDRVRQLYEREKVSTVLVMGGSGDYFDVADTVILMDRYEPCSVTEEVRKIVANRPNQRKREVTTELSISNDRRPVAGSFDASRGRRDVKIDARGLSTILFGTENIDLSAVEQLVDSSQTRAIGEAILFFSRRYAAEGMSLRDGLEMLDRELQRQGLDILVPYKVGNLARPRRLEIASAINRFRKLRVQ
ncbi:MAG: ABC-ATPase domain-containing protein [Acidobacteriota bacterium]|nr:MAG: ABC-ATPase domain-containing protein [Acidobacteriota bacterium]